MQSEGEEEEEEEEEGMTPEVARGIFFVHCVPIFEISRYLRNFSEKEKWVQKNKPMAQHGVTRLCMAGALVE